MLGIKGLKIGIAFPAFKTSFAHFLPNIEVVKDNPFNYDLIIFSGGEDINPSLYRQKETYASGISFERDEIELGVLRQIYRRSRDISSEKLYILGVCRGHQLINAVNGGGLIQDIFMEYKKSHPGIHGLNFRDPQLPISLSTTTEMLSNFFNKEKNEYEVNSMHHQGVTFPGNYLTATSLYGGVIESTESERIITVQWHPEFMDSYQFFGWLLNKITHKQNLFNRSKDEEKLSPHKGIRYKVDTSDFDTVRTWGGSATRIDSSETTEYISPSIRDMIRNLDNDEDNNEESN